MLDDRSDGVGGEHERTQEGDKGDGVCNKEHGEERADGDSVRSEDHPKQDEDLQNPAGDAHRVGPAVCLLPRRTV